VKKKTTPRLVMKIGGILAIFSYALDLFTEAPESLMNAIQMVSYALILIGILPEKIYRSLKKWVIDFLSR
jgi:hypothetical protein